MKIQKTSTQRTFQPIEIKITIESQEELNHLLKLQKMSESIQLMLVEEGCVDHNTACTLEFLLDDIGECL